MALSSFGSSPAIDALLEDIAKYELEQHVLELEAYGLTVVPPRKLGATQDFVGRLRDAIVHVCERRNGVTIGDYHTASDAQTSQIMRNSWKLLDEDEVFIEAATNPVMLTLVRWLCGQSAVLGGHTWILKPPSDDSGLGWHTDAHGIFPGGGHVAHMCNASWLCTDYEGEDDGPTVLVPGSHRFNRATYPHERDGDCISLPTIPLMGEAGSLAVWHGMTWHQATRRSSPGLRITLLQIFMRMHMRPLHASEDTFSEETHSKYPDLARILRKNPYPFGVEGADMEAMQSMIATGRDRFE